MAVEPHIIAERGEQWLVDVGNGNGRIYDTAVHKLLPPRPIASVMLRGYWEYTDRAPKKVTAAIEEMLGTKLSTNEWYDQ